MKIFKKLLCLVLLMGVGSSNVAFADHLQVGSRGAHVKEVQQSLDKKGYKGNNKLRIDGIFGEETQRAVISFQNANGLNPNGVVDLATKRALGIYLQRTLQKGHCGEDVRDLQIVLKEKGCGLNGATGNFQEKTYNAVKKFQDRNNLNPTGIADDTTILRLNSPSTTCTEGPRPFPNINFDVSIPLPVPQQEKSKGTKVKVRRRLSKEVFEHIQNNINEVGRQMREAIKQGAATINIKGEIVEVAAIVAVFIVFLPLLA
ncbi:MAG: hypothetical protein RUMPE_01317 [Eubacteriales bacterium SKADARSKE-1]|nr:hypothetical protein [Eubacteriales bacterium SKADARSKE-1]MDQ5984271.1 hypothetical protein [Eubacteriales bacterium SKADARSKE-1]